MLDTCGEIYERREGEALTEIGSYVGDCIMPESSPCRAEGSCRCEEENRGRDLDLHIEALAVMNQEFDLN